MKTRIALTAAALFMGTMAMADRFTDQIVADLSGQGFERIEIKNGITQIKVEAIRGTQKVEVIYDRSTGAIIKQEVERVQPGDDTAPGVEISTRNRDFVDANGRGDDDDDDDDDNDRRDDDDDDDSSRDEDDDDDRGRDDDDDDDDSDDDEDDDSDDDDDDDDDSDDDDDDDDD